MPLSQHRLLSRRGRIISGLRLSDLALLVTAVDSVLSVDLPQRQAHIRSTALASDCSGYAYLPGRCACKTVAMLPSQHIGTSQSPMRRRTPPGTAPSVHTRIDRHRADTDSVKDLGEPFVVGVLLLIPSSAAGPSAAAPEARLGSLAVLACARLVTCPLLFLEIASASIQCHSLTGVVVVCVVVVGGRGAVRDQNQHASISTSF